MRSIDGFRISLKSDSHVSSRDEETNVAAIHFERSPPGLSSAIDEVNIGIAPVYELCPIRLFLTWPYQLPYSKTHIEISLWLSLRLLQDLFFKNAVKGSVMRNATLEVRILSHYLGHE